MLKKQYKSNKLSKVIFRLDFEKIELGSLEKFNNTELKKAFPTYGQKKVTEGNIEVNLKDGKVIQKNSEFAAYSFENDKKNKRFEVCEKYIFLEYDKYSNFKEVLNDAKSIIERFIVLFEVKTINRMGLRYINEVNLNEKNALDWKKYINNDLMGNINFIKGNSKKISRSMGQIVFREEEGDLTFNFGIFNKQYPNEVVTKEFILDYDCYSRLPFEVSEENILNKLEKYHSYIGMLFESSINDGFRKLLNK